MTTEKHKTQRSETKLVGEGRIAFPFLHERRTKQASGKLLDKPRYDAVFMMPKLHADPMQCANYNTLAAMCVEAATKAWGSFPQGGKWPIQDGDVPQIGKPKPGIAPLTPEQIAAKNKWRVGYWIIEVSTMLETGPKVALLQNGVAQDIPAKVMNGVQLYKSGDYGYASISAYTFQNETFGVNIGVEGVLFTRPGEQIGGGGQRSTQQMFGSIAGTAAPMAPPAPGAAMPPPGLPQPSAAPPAAPVAPAAPPPLPPAAPLAPPMAPGMAPPPGVLPAFPVPGQ